MRASSSERVCSAASCSSEAVRALRFSSTRIWMRVRSSASAVASARMRSRSRSCLAFERHEMLKIAGELLGLAAQFRHHRAQQHGAADRRKRILRPDDDRRRRLAAHALQRGQHIGQHAAPRRSANRGRSSPRRAGCSSAARPCPSCASSSLARSPVSTRRCVSDALSLSSLSISVAQRRLPLLRDFDVMGDGVEFGAAVPAARRPPVRRCVFEAGAPAPAARHQRRPTRQRVSSRWRAMRSRALDAEDLERSTFERSVEIHIRSIVGTGTAAGHRTTAASLFASQELRPKRDDLLAMIGMAREDRHGAVDLLGEQQADDLVRPGHRPESQRFVRRAPCIAAPWPSAPPMAKTRSLTPPSRSPRDPPGEIRRLSGVLPRSSRSNEPGASRQRPPGSAPRLLRHAILGAAGAAFRKFTHRDAQDRAPRPVLTGALEIALDERAGRDRPSAGRRNRSRYASTSGSAGRTVPAPVAGRSAFGASGDHIFSIL